jgi:hypothetical protein
MRAPQDSILLRRFGQSASKIICCMPDVRKLSVQEMVVANLSFSRKQRAASLWRSSMSPVVLEKPVAGLALPWPLS